MRTHTHTTQRAFHRRFSYSERNSLARTAWIERLELELEMIRGLRLLGLSLCIFFLVAYAATLEKRSTARLGLLNSYKSFFHLTDDYLKEIKTQDQLYEYIEDISKQSRMLLPLSSVYFVEDTGQMKLLQGVSKFVQSQILDVVGLEPIIDAPVFSMIAWIRLKAGAGANIVRKPLGSLPDEIKLSCWLWYVGAPADRVEFGAHDFRGGMYDTSLQEIVLSTAEHNPVATGDRLHMVALVANKTTVSFYTDAKLQSAVPLRRPITDCSGRTLIVGDNDIPRFGDITFFPRELSTQEMVEIRSSGFTFESLAAGKMPSAPETTQFDTSRAVQAAEFVKAQGERIVAEQKLAIESTLSRQVTISTHSSSSSVDPAKINVSNVFGCPDVPIFNKTTSCHIMSNFTTYYTDTRTTGGKEYLPMIQPAYLPTGYHPTDRMLLDHLYNKEFLRYNATEWPSFCGQSATFSMWIENWETTDSRSTIFARYPEGTSKRKAGSWFWQLDQDPGGTLICVGQIPVIESVAYWKCVTPTVRLNGMYRNSRRHLAMVLNHQDDTIKFYLDGEIVGTLSAGDSDGFPWISDSLGSGVGRLDCKLNEKTGYTALGHRVAGGGEKPYRGPVQDWRYYVGQALTASEIKTIATKSVDKNGKILRTCSFRTEGQDSKYKDSYGNDCAWYRTRVSKNPELCSSEIVRNACPVACRCLYGTSCLCFTAQDTPKAYFIWDKVMPIREYDMTLDTNGDSICVREGLDVVADCRKNEANPQSFPVIGYTDYSTSTNTLAYKAKPKPTTRLAGQGNGRWCNIPPGPQDDVCNNLKVWDCNVLEKAVNPSCSFQVDNDWSKTINSEIKQNGGYTLSFWWKAMELTKWESINKGQMVFFSSLVPPRVLFVLDFYGKGEGENIWYWMEAYNTNGDTFENFNNVGGEKFEINTWYHVGITIGADDPSGGNAKYIMLMAGSQPSLISTSLTGYMPNTEDLIQAITVVGGLMYSPIQIISKPMSVSELQSYYYTTVSAMNVRRGPVSFDEDRTALEIEYSVPPAGYPYQMSLVAPPILLQTRRERTGNCTYAVGTEYNKKVWETAIEVTCQLPYVCPDYLTTVPTSLMACSLRSSPERFLGRETISAPGGREMYFEFLQSIVDAPFLVRDDVPVSTRAFLDSQTESVSCLMIGYSPQYGIVSTINIHADLEADVKVDFEINHYQSLEGDDLSNYLTIVIVAYVLVAIVFVEKLVTLRHRDWTQARAGFLMDMCIQVVLPVLYFALRVPNIRDSKTKMLQTIGVEGLAGVPWESRELDLDYKVRTFFKSLNKLDALNNNEKSMSIFYFVLSSLQLLRLIFQTLKGLDDLWHFFLLLSIILLGFIVLGTSQFSDTRFDFSTSFITFETLWTMMLGNMLSSGTIPSTFWTGDKMLMIYSMLFNFLSFFFMLNFIIAIICECYIDVSRRVKDSDADNEFFTDCTQVVCVALTSLTFSWPPHRDLIRVLKEMKKHRVGVRELRVLFPDIGPTAVSTILAYYRSTLNDVHETENTFGLQRENEMMMQQISVMMGVPKPNVIETIAKSRMLKKAHAGGRSGSLVDALVRLENVSKFLRNICLLDGLVPLSTSGHPLTCLSETATGTQMDTFRLDAKMGKLFSSSVADQARVRGGEGGSAATQGVSGRDGEAAAAAAAAAVFPAEAANSKMTEFPTTFDQVASKTSNINGTGMTIICKDAQLDEDQGKYGSAVLSELIPGQDLRQALILVLQRMISDSEQTFSAATQTRPRATEIAGDHVLAQPCTLRIDCRCHACAKCDGDASTCQLRPGCKCRTCIAFYDGKGNWDEEDASVAAKAAKAKLATKEAAPAAAYFFDDARIESKFPISGSEVQFLEFPRSGSVATHSTSAPETGHKQGLYSNRKPPANAQVEASLVFDDLNGANYTAVMLSACPSNTKAVIPCDDDVTAL